MQQEILRPFGNLPELKHEEYNNHFIQYLEIPNFLSLKDIKTVKGLWTDDKVVSGKINNGETNESIRKSKVLFLDPNEQEWLYDKLAVGCIMVNATIFKFDITGFQTALQLSNYIEGDYYGWHMDTGKGKNSIRKLSISIQLTDQSEYEGGTLQFLYANGERDASKNIGTAIIFPSFVYHRVQPVTMGSRQSLVGWIAGPPYR